MRALEARARDQDEINEANAAMLVDIRTGMATIMVNLKAHMEGEPHGPTPWRNLTGDEVDEVFS